jgi:putative addiction module component (TIGR02574 family)
MNIEIESLSVPEKLALVDQIWASIRRDSESVPSPEWHKEVLEERLRRLESGEATTSSLADVKKRLGNRRD